MHGLWFTWVSDLLFCSAGVEKTGTSVSSGCDNNLLYSTEMLALERVMNWADVLSTKWVGLCGCSCVNSYFII